MADTALLTRNIERELIMTTEYKKPLSAEEASFEVHAWLFKPPTSDRPSRAISLDRMFAREVGYKFASKLTMSFMGFFLFVGSVVISYEALMERIRSSSP